jgi:putative mycofactocin binding protein MftB
MRTEVANSKESSDLKDRLLPGAVSDDRRSTNFSLDSAWALHPRVAVRPERFGALLYSFDTRRLSFLKSRQLLEVVSGLAAAPTARQACDGAGVAEADLPDYTRALAWLAAGGTIVPRET